MKRIFTRRILLSLIGIMLIGLYKVNAQAPTITSFTPLSGLVGDTVTITGTSFNSTPSNNIIFFGATRATVITSTATSLKVRVPIGASYAPLTVLNNITKLISISNRFFNPMYSPNKGSITTSDFSNGMPFQAGASPKALAAADFDGDGQLDLAITNNYNGSANTVSVLRNLSNPSNLIFDTALDFATGISPISPSIGDFDGDNKLDLVTVNSSNSSVSVLRNTSIIGAINFATKIDFTTGMVPKSVAISDLDGDGKLDLAVTNELSNTISIFRNTSNLGSISFSSKVDFPTGSGPASVSICDLDGNSKPDLIIANGGTNTISIIRNICTIGNINFSPKTDITTGTAPKYITVGDLDGDNSPDIAISNTNSNTLSILRNTSSPNNINFNAKVDFNTGPGAVSISIGDLDADGKPDLAIANNYNNISIYPNTSISGTIGFSNKVDFITASNPQAVLIADLDGDGKLDFATAHNSGPFYIFRNIPQFPAPTITSISPTSGVVGDTLEIIGTGFSSTPTKNIVYFGATRANIISVNTNSIKVTVPNGTTYGPISLLNTSIEKIAYSSQFFKQTFRPNKNTITNADFDSKLNFGPGYLTERVSIGDLDGDGKPDLAIVRTNSISILRNTCVLGGINFASTVDFNIGQNPNSLDIGDIDGDGKQDIAITYGSSISIMRNNSNIGVLNFISTYAIANNAYSIEINDMDGDGKPDLVVGDINNGIVSLYLNNGSKGLISFANKIDISIGFPCAFVVGDIDGDRKPDIVVVNSGVSILRNTSSIGVLSFVAQVGFSIGLNPSALIALGDIDADGRLDLGVANYNNNTVSVLRNTSSIGSVSFTTKVDFPTGMGPSSVAFGDINGDGKLDLTITNSSSNSNSVSVLCNIGSLNAINFATKVDFGTSLIPRSTEIGDIDGDGKPELVITGDASIAVMRNNPKIPPTITSFIPQNAAFGDTLKIIGTSFSDTIANNIVFLGSAKATVIAANDSIVKIVVPAGASFAPITLLNTSNALAGISSQFFNPIFRPSKGSINSGDIAAKLDFVSSSQPVSAIIGDIDLDGKPDLAIANRGSNSVSILRNIGNSNAIGFASKIDFPTGIQPSSIAFGDINGDGKPDLAISNRTSNTISILRNTSTTGSISFANKIDFITNIGPNSVVIGDFNGDGKLDLATANDSSNTISVLRNTSTTTSITFASKLDYITGTKPTTLATGDIDGNNRTDLITTNYVSNTISIFKNIDSIGTINFNVKADFISGPNPRSIAIGDLDGNGKVDLAVTNNSNNKISVLRNISNVNNLNFAPKVDFSVSANPYSIAIGDIDGDSKPDIATANQIGNNVSILRNLCNIDSIAFETNIDFNTGNGSTSIAIGDLNGDGKSDLAIANQGSDNISILRNNPQPPPSITAISNLNSFSSCFGLVSAQQTITVSGIGLTTNLIVTAPQGFEISASTSSGFTNNINLTQSSGVVNNTLIYVRLNSSITGVLSGNIIFTSTSAQTVNVFVSGVVKAKSTSTTNDSICLSELPYIWNSKTYNTSAIDSVHFINAVGCDSTAVLNLTIKRISTTNISICPSQLPYVWNGKTYNTAKTDTVYYSNSVGCDSAAIIILSIKPTSASTSIIKICSNQLPYVWNGRTYNIAKTDTVKLINSVGCDSLAIIILSIKSISTSTSNINICPSQLPYLWNGRTYNSAKSDTVHFTNSVGCDSAAIIILMVKPTSFSNSSFSICPSQLPFNWNGKIFNSAKIDTVHLTNSIGCDSSAIIMLSVKPTSFSNSNISICPSQLPYLWNGRTYNSAKSDTVHLINSIGCDSSAIIMLSIKPTGTSTYNTSICPNQLPYIWNGLNFTGAGSKTKTGLINSVGCDSSATLNLTIKSSSASTNNLIVCPNQLPYIWNGLSFTGTGSKTKTGLLNSVGCDSSATLNLSLKSTSTSSSNLSICASELPYTWNGLIFVGSDTKTKTGLINAAGCDSSATLILNVNSSPNTSNIIGLSNVFRLDTASYSVNGSQGSTFNWSATKGSIQSGAGTNQIQIKWNAIGTDTLKVIETSSQGCVGLQNKLIVNVSPTSSVNEISASNKIIIYPNPTTGMVNISSSQAIETIEVFDVTGKLVLSHRNDTHQKHIELDLSAFSNGIYFIQTHNQNAEKTLNKVVISK